MACRAAGRSAGDPWLCEPASRRGCSFPDRGAQRTLRVIRGLSVQYEACVSQRSTRWTHRAAGNSSRATAKQTRANAPRLRHLRALCEKQAPREPATRRAHRTRLNSPGPSPLKLLLRHREGGLCSESPESTPRRPERKRSAVVVGRSHGPRSGRVPKAADDCFSVPCASELRVG